MKHFLKKTLLLWLPALLLSALASCSKDDVTQDPDPEVPVDNGMFYRLIRVENFKGDTVNADPLVAPKTLYYSLEQNTPVDESYQKTRKWDLAFGLLYNSYLSGNNGANANNYSYGTSAKGGITIVKGKFENITDVPADSEFKTGKDLIGPDENGDFGEGLGWYLYDFGGVYVRDGAYDNQHIAYALNEPLLLNSGVTVEPRTLIVRTANGNYAKIKLISVYKNIYDRALMFRTSPKMYFTFEYVMVPAGSSKFEIK